MSYIIGTFCKFCGGEKVDQYRAPTGATIYECDSCGGVWKSKFEPLTLA